MPRNDIGCAQDAGMNVYLRNQELETVINNHLGPADLETPLLLWEL